MPLWARRAIGVGAVTLISAALVAVFATTTTPKSQSSELFNNQTLLKRWEYWHAAVGVFVTNPVLGTGPDTFYAAYGRHRAASDGAAHGLDESPPDKPHNVFLEYAA